MALIDRYLNFRPFFVDAQREIAIAWSATRAGGHPEPSSASPEFEVVDEGKLGNYVPRRLFEL